MATEWQVGIAYCHGLAADRHRIGHPTYLAIRAERLVNARGQNWQSLLTSETGKISIGRTFLAVPTPDDHRGPTIITCCTSRNLKERFLRVSLGLVDVPQILVRHLMHTLTVLDTITPGFSPFHARVPLKYIAKGYKQSCKGWCTFSQSRCDIHPTCL